MSSRVLTSSSDTSTRVVDRDAAIPTGPDLVHEPRPERAPSVPDGVVAWRTASELRDLTAIAALLMAGAVVVPLLFTIARSDVFALPKFAALVVSSSVCLLAVLVGIRRIPPLPRWHLADTAVIVFGTWHLLAFNASMDRSQSLWGERYQYQGLVSVGIYLAAYALARVAFRTPRALVLLTWSVVAGGVAVSGYAIAQRLGFDPIWDELARGGRVFSTIGQPNALGAYLVIALPLTWVLIESPRRHQRRTGAAAATIIAVATILTLSRGAYLAATVALVVVAALNASRIRANANRIARWVTAAAVLVAATAAFSTTVSSSLAGTAHRAWGIIDTDIDDSADKHVNLWTVGMNMAIDHPIVGTGQETFPLLFPEYSRRALDADRLTVFAPYRPESPHNVYIATAAGAGLVALAAYLTMLITTVSTLVRGAARARPGATRSAVVAVAAAVAAHAVTDAFMTGELTSSWLIWLLMGAALGPADQLRRGRHAA